MKRLKNVYEQIHTFEHLYHAHRLARRGKRGNREVIRFEIDLNRNLIELQEELMSGSYRSGKYREFTIYEPKERLIMSLPDRDRVVQHSLCDNVLAPFIDRKLIDDNCASRPGRGTHFGLYRLARFMREFYHQHGTDGYILKADILKYFYRIRHDRLKEMLYPYLADRQLLHLLDVIIDRQHRHPHRQHDFAMVRHLLFEPYGPHDQRTVEHPLVLALYGRFRAHPS